MRARSSGAALAILLAGVRDERLRDHSADRAVVRVDFDGARARGWVSNAVGAAKPAHPQPFIIRSGHLQGSQAWGINAQAELLGPALITRTQPGQVRPRER